MKSTKDEIKYFDINKFVFNYLIIMLIINIIYLTCCLLALNFFFAAVVASGIITAYLL